MQGDTAGTSSPNEEELSPTQPPPSHKAEPRTLRKANKKAHPSHDGDWGELVIPTGFKPVTF